MADIIHCQDCKFRAKKEDWLWCHHAGKPIWYCTKGRGLDVLTQSITLEDFCSSAEPIQTKPVYIIKYKDDKSLEIYGDYVAGISSEDEFYAFVDEHRSEISEAYILKV